MKNIQALSQLDNFTGTEAYHRIFPGLLLTDGTKFLCENADCFWMMDIIWSYQATCKRDESLRYMQFWKLVKTMPEGGFKTDKGFIIPRRTGGDAAAYAVCERDLDDAAIVQAIPYTDFPFEAFPKGLTLYCAPLDEQNKVIYLPSEH